MKILKSGLCRFVEGTKEESVMKLPLLLKRKIDGPPRTYLSFKCKEVNISELKNKSVLTNEQVRFELPYLITVTSNTVLYPATFCIANLIHYSLKVQVVEPLRHLRDSCDFLL